VLEVVSGLLREVCYVCAVFLGVMSNLYNIIMRFVHGGGGRGLLTISKIA